MSKVLAEARTAIKARLGEIDEERRRLERVLASINRRPARRRSGRVRARPGERRQQFLEAVKNRPETPVAELARELKVAPQQLYPIARQLQQQRQIRKSGDGYRIRG